MRQKNWVCREINEGDVERLMRCVGVSRVTATVLAGRGILDCGQAEEFLNPDAGRLHDPFLMDGMVDAADIIAGAVLNSEEILIYGDYDVDGVAGTAILYNFLRSRGADVKYFIPDRMEDGYGLTMSSAQKVLETGSDLLLTVDCGITSVDEVKMLMEAGMRVIVTDHHECGDLLPAAQAVLNPHKPGDGYPFKELSGAGVALKLVQALCVRLDNGRGSASRPCVGMAERPYDYGMANNRCGGDAAEPTYTDDFMKYLDLAALATIADMVPLRGENRIIAFHGLKAMESSGNTGLASLIGAAGLANKPLSSYHAAFILAPRVNAAGRLGSADRSARLFTTGDRLLAEALAKELDSENRTRQETENDILKEAVAFIESRLNPAREKVLVVSGEGWHHGVIGIVASRVLERYNRPTIVISTGDGIGKGSGRSIAGFNLFHALSNCADLFERFGGHEMAAGLTIKVDRIGELRRRLNEYADSVLTEADLLPCVSVDAFLDAGDLTIENARELSRLAPFGLGNPGPVFGCLSMRVGDVKTMGDGKHLRFRLTKGGDRAVEAVWFNMGDQAAEYPYGSVVDAVFSMEVNSWNGTERLQLNLKDVRHSPFAEIDKKVVFDRTYDYNGYNDKLRKFGGLRKE